MRKGVNILGINAYHGDASAVLLRDGELVSLEKIPGYEERHRVRPGLTGVAQVYAPRDIPRRHKFRLDLFYIKKHTFWLDLKLIALSFWITFRGKWEVRRRKI